MVGRDRSGGGPTISTAWVERPNISAPGRSSQATITLSEFAKGGICRHGVATVSAPSSCDRDPRLRGEGPQCGGGALPQI